MSHCCGVWPSSWSFQTRRRCIFSSCLVWAILFGFSVTLLVYTATKPRPIDTNFPDLDQLEYGIQWFALGNERLPGYNLPPPMAESPTIVFAHGWQPNAAPNRLSFQLNYQMLDPRYGLDIDYMDAWLEAGWNVGVFYWTLFADELAVKDAEAKIWTTDGPQGMRWRTTDGSYSTLGSPNKSIADLFVDSYLQVFENQTSPFLIRLGGHSLGIQIVSRATNLLANMVENGSVLQQLMPSRTVLCDPYMAQGTSYDHAGLNYSIGGEVLGLWQNTLSLFPEHIMEIYQSSDINFINGNGNEAEYTSLIKLGVMTRMFPKWISFWDLFKLTSQHMSAFPIYAHSFYRTSAPSAGASDQDMRELMGTGLIEQAEGTQTYTPIDDVFVTTSWTEASPYTGPKGFDFLFVLSGVGILVIIALVCTCCLSCCGVRHRKYLVSHSLCDHIRGTSSASVSLYVRDDVNNQQLMAHM